MYFNVLVGLSPTGFTIKERNETPKQALVLAEFLQLSTAGFIQLTVCNMDMQRAREVGRQRPLMCAGDEVC